VPVRPADRGTLREPGEIGLFRRANELDEDVRFRRFAGERRKCQERDERDPAEQDGWGDHDRVICCGEDNTAPSSWAPAPNPVILREAQDL
jgi:hypothetical protein